MKLEENEWVERFDRIRHKGDNIEWSIVWKNFNQPFCEMIGTKRKHTCSTREITVVSHWNLSSEDFEFPNMLLVKGSRFVETFTFNAHFDRFAWAARGYNNQYEIEIGRIWRTSQANITSYERIGVSVAFSVLQQTLWAEPMANRVYLNLSRCRIDTMWCTTDLQ